MTCMINTLQWNGRDIFCQEFKSVDVADAFSKNVFRLEVVLYLEINKCGHLSSVPILFIPWNQQY